jgi:metal-dependent amidase/aminoacylase/carboxypeptidase family protein
MLIKTSFFLYESMIFQPAEENGEGTDIMLNGVKKRTHSDFVLCPS